MDTPILRMLQARAAVDAQLNTVLQIVAEPIANAAKIDRVVVEQCLNSAKLALDRFEEAARGA